MNVITAIVHPTSSSQDIAEECFPLRDERVREMRETEGPAMRERFAEAASALGLSLEELVAGNGKRRGRASKVTDAE